MVANAAQSMYGSLNLQFSSTATLVPMENSAVRDSGGMVINDPSVTYEVKATENGVYSLEDCEFTFTKNGEKWIKLTLSLCKRP